MTDNTIDMTVAIPIAAIREAILFAISKEFAVPAYGKATGKGWEIVHRQVRDYLTSIDLTDLIRRYTEARMTQAVDEAVTRLLQEKARQRAREMARNGELLMEAKV